MAHQPAGSEDDWVKQMLAEAMLGRKALPVVDSQPAQRISLDELVVEVESEPAVECVPDEPVVQFKVVLDEPVVELVPDEAVVETPLEQPGPALASRLLERPSFDATNDPGVDEMLAAEHSEPVMLEHSDERTRLRGALEWLAVLGSAVVVALLLREFLFQAFFIPSESMEATLQIDDRVLVNKLSYRIGDVERGEVVVFRRPDDQPGEFRDLIKRVIGLPGESIEARDNTIFIDGLVLIEPYLTPGEVIGDFGPVLVPEGEYFVMGDNRDNSGDSRVFGTVPEDRFIGRAFFLFWPLDRIGSL